jgi:hypothetical protein
MAGLNFYRQFEPRKPSRAKRANALHNERDSRPCLGDMRVAHKCGVSQGNLRTKADFRAFLGCLHKARDARE